MAAYAALVTLSKAIHQLLPYEQHYSFLCAKHQMKSLLDKVNSFQVFLEGISGKLSDGIDELESRIRDVAHRLEDIVESILVHSLAMEYQNEVNSRLSIQGAEDRDVSRKSRKRSAEGSMLKITLYGKESSSILALGATDTKVALEDDVSQTTGHGSTVPSTSAESETSLDGKVVSQSLLILSPGSTDTKVVLEDDVNQTTGHMEYENQVNSRLSFQGDTQFTFGAEGRAVSRKSRKPRKSVKDGSAEASISVTAEDLFKLKITLYGKESSSILSPGATKVALEDDVNKTTGHESTVPSTSAESETSLDGKAVSGSLSILSPGATDTKVVLEDDVNQTTGHLEYENEVNSRLSIQGANTQFTFGAEGRAVSRKSRKPRKSVKDGSVEAHHRVREEDILEMKKTLDGSLSILTPSDVNQTTDHESTLPSTSAKSETETSLDNILGWCLDDQDLEDKAKFPPFFLTERAAAAFGNCIEEATEMKKTPGDVNQNTGHEHTLPSTSAKSKTETRLDKILRWCLDDQDLEDKAKYSHFPLTERVAAAFGNCIEEADLLLEEAMEMKKNLDNRVVISGTSITTTSLSRGQPDANDTMVGLRDELNQILDRITRRQPALEVIPITGMGGIGKTTLARAVYDHHRKQDHFDLVLWATVSQQYNVKEILRSLLPVDAEKKEPNKALCDLVHQRLYSRRYLIILDDVWDENVWDGVRNAFPNHNNRSRVILTTRLSNVATNIIGSSSTHDAHQMQLLNGEQSWDLLRETVYGHEIGCLSNFEYYIGRRISRNCKGLPLALVVIGGLLKLNTAEDHWEHVATSTTAEAVADDESMLRILSLSYTNLPPHLKACFLYFGMFPEDEEIPTKELVRLWCAEGFLKPRDSKTMEVVAEECLEELVERNLILAKKTRYNGKIKTSSIHDILRELSLTQAQTEKFLYFHDGSSEIDNDTFLSIIKDQPRRVSFPEFNPECSISYNSPIRTFRTHKRSGMIPQFKLVRVLGKVELSSSAVALRNSVRLNNLRYLHLHKKWGDEESLIMVPKSISKLRNLETLFLSGGNPFSKKYDLILPVEIWEMPRLRHLLVSEHVNLFLPPFPEEDSSISIESSSLQTLTGLMNFGDFSPRVIQKLQQNLKKLHIRYQRISF